MTRLLKRLLAGVLALVALVVVAGGVFVSVFDVNDYKAEISDQVGGAIGREFNIGGDIELSLWPDIGLAVGGVEMPDARGFGKRPFLEVEEARATVRLLPLLSGEVQVAGVALKGAHLKLVQNRNGANNWDDLAGQSRATDAREEMPASDGAGGALLLGALGRVELEDVSVAWKDNRNGDSWQLHLRRFETDVSSDFETRLQLEDLAAEFDVKGNMQGVTDGVDLRGVTLDTERFSTAIGGDSKVRQSLTGDITLALQNGRFTGAGGSAFLKTAENIAAFLQGRAPAVSGDALVIESVRATLALENGVGRNDNLSAKLPLFNATGEGQVDFARMTADYTLHLQLKGGDQRIPVRITGPLNNLDYDIPMPDFVRKLREFTGQAGQKIKKEAERAKEKVQEELGRAKEKAGEKAQELLDKVRDKLKLPF